MFSAHAGIELYAEAFEAAGRLERLEGFAADFGADFYGLPRNTERIRLAKRDWTPPANYPFRWMAANAATGADARRRTVAWQLVP